MTISTFPVDKAIQAYTKQNKVRIRTDSSPQITQPGRYTEEVSLSEKKEDRPYIFNAAYYTLQDIMSGKKNPTSNNTPSDIAGSQTPTPEKP